METISKVKLDRPLAAQAKLDLTGPSTAKEMLALADAWWACAEKQDELLQAQIRRRAGHWYGKAKALDELRKSDAAKAEKRANETAVIQPMIASQRTGVARAGNVALASIGATVTGPADGSSYLLIDGNSTVYDKEKGFTQGSSPATWVVTFDRVYQVRVIRLKLYDHDPDWKYRYAVFVSADGRRFEVVGDRSKGQWYGWQTISFSARPVKAVKLVGIHNTGYKRFRVVELEAFCTRDIPNPPRRVPPPPEKPPKKRSR